MTNANRLIVIAIVAFLVIFGVSNTKGHSAAAAGDAKTAQHAAEEAEAQKIVDEFFQGAESKVACPAARSWTAAELKQHATPEDLLIVVRGFVLNVTTFLQHHPGGNALLRGAGGVDAGDLFSQFHQPGTLAMFHNFCVGRAANLPKA